MPMLCLYTHTQKINQATKANKTVAEKKDKQQQQLRTKQAI